MESKLKLNFAHVCDMAFLSQEGKVNIIGIFKIIFSAKFPTVHPKLSVVTSFDTKESSGKHKQTIEIVQSGLMNRQVSRIDFDFEIKGNKEVNLIADISNVKFDESGKYSVNIFVDDTLVKEIPLLVKDVSL